MCKSFRKLNCLLTAWHWFIVALLLSIVMFAGCSREISQPANISTRSVTDDLGRLIDLPQHVSRAISLAPSITESIFAAGAGDRLVGVTTYCNFPAETASIEKIGDTLNPNIEKIIALRPDIVLVSTASQLEAFMSTLQEQKIAVYVIDARSIAEVIEDLRKLGGIFETEKIAAATASELERRVDKIEASEGPEASQRVFIQISNEPLFTIGKDSFLTEMIEKAGGSSVTRDVPSAYPKLSKESASAMNPNVIIMSDSDDNREPNSSLKNSSAVKAGRVYRINADIISRPGPRSVDALEEIFKLIRKY